MYLAFNNMSMTCMYLTKIQHFSCNFKALKIVLYIKKWVIYVAELKSINWLHATEAVKHKKKTGVFKFIV